MHRTIAATSRAFQPAVIRRAVRFLPVLVAVALVIGQGLLVLHSLEHAVGNVDEQHHCSTCKLADSVPLIPAKVAGIAFDCIEVRIQIERPDFPPAPLPSSFLPRGPPANLG